MQFITLSFTVFFLASCSSFQKNYSSESKFIQHDQIERKTASVFNNKSIDREITHKITDNLKFQSELKETKKNCFNNQTLKKITNVPVNKNDPESFKAFDFYYDYVVKSESDPTIIYLPGGPGSGSINEGKGFPDSYNIIYIDPRGVGCNFKNSSDFPPKYFGTNFVTDDIVLLIQKLQLKNYIIYGASYGTVLATYVAHKIGKDKSIKPPRGVLLEGVLGKAWGTWDTREKYRAEVATRFINENPKVKALLKDPENLPFEYPPEFWGYKLQYAGRVWKDRLLEMNTLYDFLNGDETEKYIAESLRKSYEFFLKSFKSDKREEMGFIFKQVACSELGRPIDNGKLIPVLDNGEIITIDHPRRYIFGDQCIDVTLPYKPYDSRDFQISAPIVYINGETDTATPLKSALYHFKNQEASEKKTFLEVKNGGHYPFSENPLECQDKIYEQIFNLKHDFSLILDASGRCLN